jgi:energy-coupling factor transport system ATP-binding protein
VLSSTLHRQAASLDVRGLSVRFPGASSRVLAGVDLSVRSGEAVGLVGRSGCGKTTLLQTVVGLMPWMTPAWVEGAVAVGGESVTELDPGQRARLIATCLDRPESQLFLATVRHEIEAARRLYGGSAPADTAVEAFGLGGLLDRRVTELSSGERQRVAVAVALAAVPRLILLDEPTAHLDAAAERALVGILGQATRQGSPVVVTEQAGWRLDGAVGRWLELDRGRSAVVETPRAPAVASPTHTPGDRVVLSCRGLVVKRGERVLLEALDLDLREGEVVLLTGPNGSGKSTLAKVLAGLSRPAAGAVRHEGRCALMMAEAELQLFGRTVAAEVAAPGTRPEERARVLRLHRLEHLAARAPWTLSRGEQQRLVHAALDLLRPDVLLVDEPGQGLDADDLSALLELVRRRSAKGRAYLVISHRPEIAAVAHRRLRIHDRRIEEVGG